MKRTGISRRPSKAKRDFDAIYASVLPVVLARGCEFTQASITTSVPSVELLVGELYDCRGRLVGHHAKGRDLEHPYVSNDPDNLRCLCRKHHDYVHSNGRWAREVGLMLSRVS